MTPNPDRLIVLTVLFAKNSNQRMRGRKSIIIKRQSLIQGCRAEVFSLGQSHDNHPLVLAFLSGICTSLLTVELRYTKLNEV